MLFSFFRERFSHFSMQGSLGKTAKPMDIGQRLLWIERAVSYAVRRSPLIWLIWLDLRAEAGGANTMLHFVKQWTVFEPLVLPEVSSLPPKRHAIHFTSFRGLLSTKLPHADISPSLYVYFYTFMRVCKMFPNYLSLHCRANPSNGVLCERL